MIDCDHVTEGTLTFDHTQAALVLARGVTNEGWYIIDVAIQLVGGAQLVVLRHIL